MGQWRTIFHASMQTGVCIPQQSGKCQVSVVSLQLQHLGNSEKDFPEYSGWGDWLNCWALGSSERPYLKIRGGEQLRVSAPASICTYIHIDTHLTHMNIHSICEIFFQLKFISAVSLCASAVWLVRAHEYSDLFLHWMWFPQVHFLRSNEARNQWHQCGGSLQTPGLQSNNLCEARRKSG